MVSTENQNITVIHCVGKVGESAKQTSAMVRASHQMADCAHPLTSFGTVQSLGGPLTDRISAKILPDAQTGPRLWSSHLDQKGYFIFIPWNIGMKME